MEMKEEWLMPGAVVPVDAETTAALVAEIKRLIGVVGGMALNIQPAQHERVQPDSECKEDDGCPTEKAVLQRFWRKAQQQEPVAVYVGETWCGSVVRLYEDLPLETPLYTSPQPSKPNDCARSHPHENMDAMCELRTEIARLTNENARLKSQRQEPVAYMDVCEKGQMSDLQFWSEPDNRHQVPLYTSSPANANAGNPWVGLNDDDLDGYTKSNVLMVRHFERVLFERNTQPCLEGLPEPIRTPPEKGTEYWTIGLGRWTWGGTTHDYSSLGNGIWRCETDVWEVHAAIRRALGIESNIAAVFQNRHEAKLRERNEHREKNA